MAKRLLRVIGIFVILIFTGVFIYDLLPVPFPVIEGMAEIDPGAPKQFIKTPSGLKYRILRKGNGHKPDRSDVVLTISKEWLSTGHVLHDYFKNLTPVRYRVSLSTSPGVKEAVQLVSEGGVIEAIIPPMLAYGKRGHSKAKTPNHSSVYIVIQLEKILKGYLSSEPGKIDDDAPTEYTKTESGLQYKILRKSDGQKPVKGDLMMVHFKGEVTSDIYEDQYFKNTYIAGHAFEWIFDDQVKGVQEGIQKIGVGGMIDLIVPPELGYGDVFVPMINKNSTLHYVIELKEIRKHNVKPKTKPKTETEAKTEAKK